MSSAANTKPLQGNLRRRQRIASPLLDSPVFDRKSANQRGRINAAMRSSRISLEPSTKGATRAPARWRPKG